MFKNAYTFGCDFVKAQGAKLALGGAAVLTAVSSAVPAHALPILDLSIASTAITTELTPALAAAMPIAGTIIAVGVGYKMFKHFVK